MQDRVSVGQPKTAGDSVARPPDNRPIALFCEWRNDITEHVLPHALERRMVGPLRQSVRAEITFCARIDITEQVLTLPDCGAAEAREVSSLGMPDFLGSASSIM